MVNPSGSTWSYFMSTLDPVAQALAPKILLLDTSDEGTALFAAVGCARTHATELATAPPAKPCVSPRCALQRSGNAAP